MLARLQKLTAASGRAVTLLALLGAPLLRADPVISEIMAANTRTLADDDGNFSDWIEIGNPANQPLDLAGWFLTDDPIRPTQWAFPHVILPAQGRLLVFASGKDHTNNAAPLHTNFRLSAGGGFLALFRPDGITRGSALDPYPQLRPDTSFGDAERVSTISFLSDTTPKILVPVTGSDLPDDWNQASLNPGPEWISGLAPTAIGFDAGPAAGGGVVNLARTGTPAPVATQSSTLSGFIPGLAINGDPGDFTHTQGNDAQATWTLDLGRRALIRSITLNNRTSCCGSRLRDITVQVLGVDQSVVFTSPLLNPKNTGFVYPNGPDHLDVNLANPVVGRWVRIKRQPDPTLTGTGGQGNSDEANVLSLGEVAVLGQEILGYQPFIRTDLQSVMLKHNASAFVRAGFAVQQPTELSDLTLRLRYDDGFVAYLNGVEVARRNAPATPVWNSAATTKREVADAVQWVSVDLTPALGQLHSGTNLLAFQALNFAASDPNFLLEPQLLATRHETATNVFLATPSPGAANLGEFYLGEVADTKFNVDRGFFDAPFALSLTSATPAAKIYFSVNGDEPGPGKGTLYQGPLTLTNTTILRMRAFREGWRPTDVDTATYIFPADVIRQAANWSTTRVPPPNFPATWGANSVDYGMDPTVVAKYSLADWKDALTQLPSVSIVTEMANLFDASTGIYANASGHGEEWERPASIEFLEATNAVPGRFHERCGLRIRGGYSRNPQFIKHSFRVFFRSEFGAAKLSYPLFGDDGAREFDTFDLRTSQNYSWTGGDPHDTLVREEFCEETLGALGQPYRRNRYTHVYLNGQYWGIYEFDERPEASYGATYFGGDKANYDVVKCGNHVANFVTEATDGNMLAWSNLWTMTRTLVVNPSNANYFRILGCGADGMRDPQLPVMLDVDNLIDYLLEIFYSGDGDATLSSFLGNNQPNNWFGMRDRTNPEVGFRFFNSDCEHTLGSPNSQVDRTGPFGGSNEGNFQFSNPQWMHEELLRNAEYRLRFADHVQRHFFDGGALTYTAATNRFLRKAAQLVPAIRAYSARWGDAARKPALGQTDWQTEINWILKNWFPNRTQLVLDQLRADKLFPAITAPRFNHAAGEIPAAFALELTQTNAGGLIYYTRDGTDPRLVNGVISPTAVRFDGTFQVSKTTEIRARVVAGTVWSAQQQAVFRPAQDLTALTLSEIMYHPAGTTGVDGDEFEFVEMKNSGTVALDLSGVAFADGISFTFPTGTSLAAGGFAVLVRNPSRFAERYPGVQIAGTYTGKLSNSGEVIQLNDAAGRTLRRVAYGTAGAWPVAADGSGPSLVPRTLDPGHPAGDNALDWRGSRNSGGSPGADDPNSTPVVIRLQIDSLAVTPQGVTLVFEADADRPYGIQARTDLTSGAWIRVAEVPAEPVPHRATVVDPTPGSRHFYRVVTP